MSAGCCVVHRLGLAAAGEPSSLELPWIGVGNTEWSGSSRCMSGAS